MNKDEWRAMVWFRSGAPGRSAKALLLRKLQEAREKYERENASKQQRQIVLAYRDALRILYETDLENLT